MKKTILPLLVVFAFALGSCQKGSDKFSKFEKGIDTKIPHSDVMIKVESEDYEKIEIEPIEREGDHGACVKGSFEYYEKGVFMGKVVFEDYKKAKVYDKQNNWKDHFCQKDGAKGEYTKIIVDPIVEMQGCDYIVEGTIEFIDAQGNWVATIDYGDGTCDNIAVKTTSDGVYTFSLDDWK